MVSEITLRRREFVQTVGATSINVGEAKSNPELRGIDFAKVDKNGDGVISGRREARGLYRELEKIERDRSIVPRLTVISGGKRTEVGAKVEALATLGKAASLQRLFADKAPTAEHSAERQYAEKVIDAALARPDLNAVAQKADAAFQAGDYALYAKYMRSISENSPQLAASANLLADQAEFCAAVKEKGGACSFPPKEAELRAYFKTFAATKDTTGAIEAFKKYADRFYLDSYSDTELPADKQNSDIVYSPQHTVAWKYYEQWSTEKCGDRRVDDTMGAREPLEWKQVTEERELIEGRRLIDCEGFAYLGGALLREALPEKDWEMRFLAVKQEGYAGHALTEFLPKEKGSPVLVSSKHIYTNADLDPADRKPYLNGLVSSEEKVAKDAYLMLRLGYNSDAPFYDGKTLSEAIAKLSAGVRPVNDPFALTQTGTGLVQDCKGR